MRIASNTSCLYTVLKYTSCLTFVSVPTSIHISRKQYRCGSCSLYIIASIRSFSVSYSTYFGEPLPIISFWCAKKNFLFVPNTMPRSMPYWHRTNRYSSIMLWYVICIVCCQAIQVPIVIMAISKIMYDTKPFFFLPFQRNILANLSCIPQYNRSTISISNYNCFPCSFF